MLLKSRRNLSIYEAFLETPRDENEKPCGFGYRHCRDASRALLTRQAGHVALDTIHPHTSPPWPKRPGVAPPGAAPGAASMPAGPLLDRKIEKVYVAPCLPGGGGRGSPGPPRLGAGCSVGLAVPVGVVGDGPCGSGDRFAETAGFAGGSRLASLLRDGPYKVPVARRHATARSPARRSAAMSSLDLCWPDG